MPQFEVYRNDDTRSRARIPFLVDVQSDLLSNLQTRVVVPLVLAESFGTPIKRLNPGFRIANRNVVLSAAEIAGIDRRELRTPVSNLAAARDAIVAAIDFVITGV